MDVVRKSAICEKSKKQILAIVLFWKMIRLLSPTTTEIGEYLTELIKTLKMRGLIFAVKLMILIAVDFILIIDEFSGRVNCCTSPLSWHAKEIAVRFDLTID